MAWKAKRRTYLCPRCGSRLGGLDVPLKRIRPAEDCPQCGTRMQLVKCSHPDVRPLAGNMSCRVCHSIVVWVE